MLPTEPGLGDVAFISLVFFALVCLGRHPELNVLAGQKGLVAILRGLELLTPSGCHRRLRE